MKSKQFNAIDLSSLRTFVDVVHTKSFTATASNIYLSQAAVSQQVKKLSDAVNHDLFYYDKKLLKLTAHGSALFNYARRMMELEDELKRDLLRIDGTECVRIGVHEPFFQNYMSQILVDFHDQHPDCSIMIDSRGSKEVLDQVYANYLNLGIVVAYDKNIESTFLTKEKLTWVCSKSRRVLEKSIIPFALFGKNSKIEDELIAKVNRGSLNVEQLFCCNSHQALIEIINNDCAISIIPERNFDADIMSQLTEDDGFPEPGSYEVHLIRCPGRSNVNALLFEQALINFFLNGSQA